MWMALACPLCFGAEESALSSDPCFGPFAGYYVNCPAKVESRGVARHLEVGGFDWFALQGLPDGLRDSYVGSAGSMCRPSC